MRRRRGSHSPDSSSHRLRGFGFVLLGLAVGAGGGLGAPAHAATWADGRLELHGYYELQVRAIARDFRASDDWDVTQLAHVLEPRARDGRAAGRRRRSSTPPRSSRASRSATTASGPTPAGCSRARTLSATTRKKLPKRLNDGRRNGFVGNVFTGDLRHYRGEPLDTFASRDRVPARRLARALRDRPHRRLLHRVHLAGPRPGARDGGRSLALLLRPLLRRAGDCKFSSRVHPRLHRRHGHPEPRAASTRPATSSRSRPSPTSRTRSAAGDLNTLYGVPGEPRAALPAGARARLRRAGPGRRRARALDPERARSPRLLRDDDVRRSRAPLLPGRPRLEPRREPGRARAEGALPRPRAASTAASGSASASRRSCGARPSSSGARTSSTRRTSRSSSLPGLEESRIALWAVRAAWSFYQVGPLEDVRLELGVNLDQFEPGRPRRLRRALHGRARLRGHLRLPRPRLRGRRHRGRAPAGRRLGAPGRASRRGVRLEWRFDRFAFALTDFYGYADLPHVEKIFTFERNVDPRTGRPRRLNDRGACVRRATSPPASQPGTGRAREPLGQPDDVREELRRHLRLREPRPERLRPLALQQPGADGPEQPALAAPHDRAHERDVGPVPGGCSASSRLAAASSAASARFTADHLPRARTLPLSWCARRSRGSRPRPSSR